MAQNKPLKTATRRPTRPELEKAFQRRARFGYEPEGSFGYVRYLEHGAPNPLIRWHYHDEYELHLIVKTSGKVFVGDYIGRFEPGNLVLTGPRLPHNWVTTDMPDEGVSVRDRVLQFSDLPLRTAADQIGELQEVLPLLENAKHGVEFIGISEHAEAMITQIQHTSGIERFSHFLMLLKTLAKHDDTKLLSSAKLRTYASDDRLQHISEIVDYLTEHYSSSFTMKEVAERFNMSESQFSRYFQRSTGNTFTRFVNQLRVNLACQLLTDTEQYISSICYHVGFNNIANFNRRFREFKGMSPRQYRIQAKERDGK